MKRPRVPEQLSGSIRVVVPKVNIWISLLAIVCAYLGIVTDSWLTLGLALGSLSVMPIAVALQWLRQARFNRRAATWPVQVQVMPGADGERIAFVTALDGTVSSLPIPDDYDPEEDGGLWLIKQVAPGLAELLDDENEETD